MRSIIALWGGAALALAGCTGTLAGGDGSGGEVAGGDLGSSEQQLTLDATEAVQIAAILGYELSGLLDDVPGLGGDPMSGPSGSLPVGTHDCTEVDWDPVSLVGISVTFDECVLDDGRMLDGGVAVQLGGALSGTVTVDLMDLAIGDRFITGTITLSVTPDDVRIDADLDYLDEDTILGIELEGVRMGLRADGIHFAGDAQIVRDGERIHAALNDVTWSPGNLCHPSDGSIDLTRSGQPAITILFSPSSVEVQVGDAEPVTIPSAC